MVNYATRDHPHLGATYRILESEGLFSVRVVIPDMHPTAISGFGSRREAERWIDRHAADVAKGLPRRIPFNRRPTS